MDRGAWWAPLGLQRVRHNCTQHSSSSVINISNAAAAAKSLQLRLTLCNPIDGSPPGSPFPGILQATVLDWVAISFSNA